MFQLTDSLETMIRSKITTDKLVFACGNDSRVMVKRCQGDKIG